MTKLQYDLDTLLEGTYRLASNYYKKGDWSNAMKWFKAISGYKDADSLSESAQARLEFETQYEGGRQALDNKDWETARDRFQKALEINPGHREAAELRYQAHKEIELPRLYELARDRFESRDWDETIKVSNEILKLDPDYRSEEIMLFREQARHKKKLEQDHRWANEQFELAEKTGKESDWRKAVRLLQDVAKNPEYAAVVNPKLTTAQKRLEFLELCQKGKKKFDRKKWRKAARCFAQANVLCSQDPYLADKCPDLQTKLDEARTKQSPPISYFLGHLRAILFAVLIGSGLLTAILVAIFAKPLAGVWDIIETAWTEIRATPKPTIAIPSVERTEIRMDGGQLRLDRLPSLTSGEAVVLEVIVFDTNGDKYTADDLVCKWSVAPLGDDDLGIDTDQCKTRYYPSQEYSNQIVAVEAKGREQQFRPGLPISMEFSITK